MFLIQTRRRTANQPSEKKKKHGAKPPKPKPDKKVPKKGKKETTAPNGLKKEVVFGKNVKEDEALILAQELELEIRVDVSFIYRCVHLDNNLYRR